MMEPSEERSFNCSLCEKKFSQNWRLIRHKREFHKEIIERKTSKKIVSPDKSCRMDFSTSQNFNDHDMMEPSEERSFDCSLCKKKFPQNFRLLRHKREFHKEIIERKTSKKIVCPDKSCGMDFSTSENFNDHVMIFHKVELELDLKRFATYSDFEHWKKDFEKETKSSYVLARTSKNLTKRFITFNCHRSGFFSSVSTGKRHLKSMGSIKIDGTCTSKINVVVTADEVEVRFCKTHFGHTCDIGHLFLSKEDKLDIANKINQGVTFKKILDDVRDSVDSSDSQRLHLLTRKDLLNISDSFNLGSKDLQVLGSRKKTSMRKPKFLKRNKKPKKKAGGSN